MGIIRQRKGAGHAAPAAKSLGQGRIAAASAVVALAASIFALYKSMRFDQRLAEMEVAQKNIDLYNARDAILGFSLGEALVTPVPRYPGTQATAPSQDEEPPLLVTVPITVKNLSKLPIAVDFNEQWAFVGARRHPDAGDFAEVLNFSNDAYPILWKRTQCLIGIGDDAWRNLGLGSLSIAKLKAEQIARLGAGVPPDRSQLVNGGVDALALHTKSVKPGTEASAQATYLRVLLKKNPYFNHTATGSACTLLNGGVLVSPLRAGEERVLKAAYVVRARSQWFSHLVRLHYRQIRLPEEHPWLCTPWRWNPLPELASSVGWRLCPSVPTPSEADYWHLDHRQVVLLNPAKGPISPTAK